jgi:drug/metabolite transporter (DMT)-like permease
MIPYMLVGLWLSWGVSYPMIGWSLEAADPLTTRLIIMPLSATLLLCCLAIAGKRLLPARGSWLNIAVAGLFNMTLFQVLMVLGISVTGPGKASIVVYTMPAWAALFSVVWLGQTISTRTTVSLGLGLVAVALVLMGDSGGFRLSLEGTLLNLAAAASFGFGTVFMKHVQWEDDLTLVCAWQLLIGMVLIFPVAFVFQEYLYLDVSQLRGVFGLLYVAVIASALAYFLWFRIIRALPVTVAGITTLVVPCIGVASSALLTDYVVNIYDIVALGLVLASISIVTFEQVSKPKAPIA